MYNVLANVVFRRITKFEVFYKTQCSFITPKPCDHAYARIEVFIRKERKRHNILWRENVTTNGDTSCINFTMIGNNCIGTCKTRVNVEYSCYPLKLPIILCRKDVFKFLTGFHHSLE